MGVLNYMKMYQCMVTFGVLNVQDAYAGFAKLWHLLKLMIVSGATKLVSIEKLLKEVGWDTLSCRRKKHEQILFYKMINGLCPDYLSSLVPLLLEIIQHIASVMHLITNTYAQMLRGVTIPFFLQ